MSVPVWDAPVRVLHWIVVASFVRGPRVVLAYARRALAGSAPRHIGHLVAAMWHGRKRTPERDDVD